MGPDRVHEHRPWRVHQRWPWAEILWSHIMTQKVMTQISVGQERLCCTGYLWGCCPGTVGAMRRCQRSWSVAHVGGLLLATSPPPAEKSGCMWVPSKLRIAARIHLSHHHPNSNPREPWEFEQWEERTGNHHVMACSGNGEGASARTQETSLHPISIRGPRFCPLGPVY